MHVGKEWFALKWREFQWLETDESANADNNSDDESPGDSVTVGYK